MSAAGASEERCPYCGWKGNVVRVHGHGQCGHCGTNFEPCCAGADATLTSGISTAVDPGLFARLFEQLGGAKVTVTSEALLFALVQHLGTDLDDAQLVLEAGERVGVVQRGGTNCHWLRGA